MKQLIVISAILTLFAANSPADDAAESPNKLFYAANGYYEARDYKAAAEAYMKIIDSGFESGSIYYNIGNSFFKAGKIGYAILFYEKARRLIPGDSDLKSNLDYARTLTGNPVTLFGSRRLLNKMGWLIRRPFRPFNINALAMMGMIIYIILILMAAFNAAMPAFARKTKALFALLVIIFIWCLAVFGMRFYYQDLLRHGIVLTKDASCKYEPVDQSMTYYKLKEGDQVQILKARSGWCQIKNSDDKIAWVDASSIGEI